MIFCQCQGQSFLTRSLDKAFLGEEQVDFLSWLCFFDTYCCHFLHSFYFVVGSVFRGGEDCAINPPLETSWRNQRQIQRKTYFFSRLLCFWDEKLINRDRFKVLSFFFLYIPSNLRFSKCRFDQRFDQLFFWLMSFRSNVVSINCFFDLCRFDQVLF